MLLGVCTGLMADGPNSVGLERIAEYKRMGFDYVELPVERMVRLDSVDQKNVLKILREYEMPCRACSNFLPGSLRVTGPEADLEEYRSYCGKVLDCMASLDAKKLVFGSGGARNVPAGYPVEKAQEQFGERLLIICGKAREYGVEVILEHLNRMESNLVTTFEESAGLVRRLHQDNLKTIYDSFHFAIGNEDFSLLEKNKDVIGHMHFARTLQRAMPKPEDFSELKDVFETVKATGYGETLSVEAYFRDFGEENDKAVEMLRQAVNN